jgi:hypothetical protein
MYIDMCIYKYIYIHVYNHKCISMCILEHAHGCTQTKTQVIRIVTAFGCSFLVSDGIYRNVEKIWQVVAFFELRI